MSSVALALRPLEFFFAQYRRVWRGTAISSVVTPVLFLLAFGFGLGELVDRSADLPDGITYLEFVAPGLIAATAMQCRWPLHPRSGSASPSAGTWRCTSASRCR